MKRQLDRVLSYGNLLSQLFLLARLKTGLSAHRLDHQRQRRHLVIEARLVQSQLADIRTSGGERDLGPGITLCFKTQCLLVEGVKVGQRPVIGFECVG
ncbi:hypothetical protein QN382_03280 [Pseudomonas sp. 10B1]|nr:MULTISPECIES: hypothetical protein [unclassified Pseudomonas]MEB0220816.1 hypothetical protein [Pseudomonas sp. AB12(2023)]MDY7562849.1 hypothetical protein [Pseudomonas sp. AB6]MEA9994352.1 hypothetical protein [Pseudomonas sp. AA4]MEB0088774.1 hypothetical protein [Pseudomonas sp. RTI1]MEB0126606.1 hypothetical protein [Pseudomonas sp. CCC1.2]